MYIFKNMIFFGHLMQYKTWERERDNKKINRSKYYVQRLLKLIS